MDIFKEIKEFTKPAKVDFEFVNNLYSIAEKNIIALGILSILLAYMLFDTYGIVTAVWCVIVLVLVSYRLYNNIMFKKNLSRYSLDLWHARFVRQSLASAFIFGVSGAAVILYDSQTEHHFLTVITLLGISSSASTSYSSDHRLSVQYIGITIMPVIAAMILYGTHMYWLMAILLFVFTTNKIFVAVYRLREQKKIARQNRHISEVHQVLKEKDNLIHNFVKEAPMAIFSCDADLKITDVNSAFLKLFDSTKDEVLGLDLAALPDKTLYNTISKGLDNGSWIYRGPYLSRKKLKLWLEIICFSYSNQHGKTAGIIGVINDKTKEQSALNTLEHNVKHDHLTSLLNRRGLNEYMDNIIDDEKHQSYYSLLFYLDLNKFKYINDSLGHKTGDALLVEISSRLNSIIPNDWIISRFGGDEFIIVSPFITDDTSKIGRITDKSICLIKDVFSSPFVLDGIKLYMQTSIGVVVIEPKSQDTEELIRHADIAMYQAKHDHDGHISFYDTNLDIERKKLFTLQHDLASAIKDNQLRIYMQPIASINNDELIAAECLIRWIHPTMGMLGPDAFIPTATETGTISDITWWVIDNICNKISTLKNSNRWKLSYISVNIDARQLLIDHFIENLEVILQKYNIQSGELMLEITERSLIDNFEGAEKIIAALRQRGINCAIDDFGVGYSSLSYLKKLSFDTLKIDRAFIKDIQYRPDDIALIRSMLDIGRQFNYDIVVEGIEESEQKKLLAEMDQRLLYQGYILQKPIYFDDFVDKYLSNNS